MNSLITMKQRVNRYIVWKRGLGYSQKTEAGELVRFARFADSNSHQGPLTTGLILEWIHKSEHNSRLYQAKKLELMRCFAKFEAAFDPGTQIPPKGLFGHAHIRIQPYIYSRKEILLLMEQAAKLSSGKGLRPRSIRTIIGLLASTGLRVCEALKLKSTDIDYDNKLIYIRETKFHKSRIIPVHNSTLRALQEYTVFRDTYHRSPQSSCFFLSEKGKSLPYSTLCWNFKQIRWCLLTGKTWTRRPPRLYDLRHTFACSRLLTWYRDGIDINKVIPSLSTYLGHIKLSDTYWYLTGIPELFSVVGERFEKFVSGIKESGEV